MINWKARLRNKYFWLGAAGVVATVVKLVKPELIPDNYNEIVNAVLTGLITMGVIIDPSSKGLADAKVQE